MLLIPHIQSAGLQQTKLIHNRRLPYGRGLGKLAARCQKAGLFGQPASKIWNLQKFSWFLLWHPCRATLHLQKSGEKAMAPAVDLVTTSKRAEENWLRWSTVFEANYAWLCRCYVFVLHMCFNYALRKLNLVQQVSCRWRGPVYWQHTGVQLTLMNAVVGVVCSSLWPSIRSSQRRLLKSSITSFSLRGLVATSSPKALADAPNREARLFASRKIRKLLLETTSSLLVTVSFPEAQTPETSLSPRRWRIRATPARSCSMARIQNLKQACETERG